MEVNENFPLFNEMLAQVPGMVFYKNTKSIYIASTNYTAQLCGFENAEYFCGNSDFELKCPASESANDFQFEDRKVMQMGKEISSLQIHQFADNKTHMFLLKKTPLKNKQGDIIGLCSIGSEIDNPITGAAIYKFLCLGNIIDTKSLNKITFEVSNELFNKLSTRESELVFYFMRGFAFKEIGIFMSVSSRTIESYLENIKNKFECHSRQELRIPFLQNGFLHVLPESLLRKTINQSLIW